MSGDEMATDEAILRAWYHFAAEQSGFIGESLQRLRERQQISLEEQQREFGASNEAFAQIQGIPMPRTHRLAADANAIAEHCGLGNPLAFVQALVLAAKIRTSSIAKPAEGQYRAAFDSTEDLDKLPDEDSP